MENIIILTDKQSQIVDYMELNPDDIYIFTYNKISDNFSWLTQNGFNKIMGDLSKLFVVSKCEDGYKFTRGIYNLEYKCIIPHKFIKNK